jgi:hypothetical protein
VKLKIALKNGQKVDVMVVELFYLRIRRIRLAICLEIANRKIVKIGLFVTILCLSPETDGNNISYIYIYT